MSLFLDIKFVDSIQHLLRNFRRKADYLWNFSCPICGDSKKNKLKARGYILRAKSKDGSLLDGLSFKCHNCSASLHFGEFVKQLDPLVYKEYTLERFKTSNPSAAREEIKRKPKREYKPVKPTVLIGCPSIATLGPDHPARIYIEKRKIPALFMKQLFWTDNFPALVDKVSPGHQFALRKEGRIIIPFLDRNFDLLAIQGRTLDPNSSVKYMTIKAFADAPRIYGMHRLGKVWKRIYIVEGPFDSMFLPNSLAMAGSDIPPSLPRDKIVVVYDNEPTKDETREKIAKAITKGYRVCIWPDTVTEKDINDMVLAGYTADVIRTMIDKFSYNGLEAKLKLQAWKRPHVKPKADITQKGNE